MSEYRCGTCGQSFTDLRHDHPHDYVGTLEAFHNRSPCLACQKVHPVQPGDAPSPVIVIWGYCLWGKDATRVQAFSLVKDHKEAGEVLARFQGAKYEAWAEEYIPRQRAKAAIAILQRGLTDSRAWSTSMEEAIAMLTKD